MIQIKNVTFYYGDFLVFENLNLKIADVGITAVTAPSGCGKTTLLRLISGLEKPQSGSILFENSEPRISYVFQEQRLLPWFSIIENVKVFSGVKKEKALSLLSKFGIDEKLAEKRPNELSGGQNQRVCIAIALLFSGDILLLDEPFTGLDEKNRSIVIEEIKKISKTKAVILVSHIEKDIKIADKIIEL
ncbi:MAG: ATP-binding cassette domain-containing protein [Clostridia bacterium]|nr:ATP-binding cassette domain-containing protein [Clostridia bacterium]